MKKQGYTLLTVSLIFGFSMLMSESAHAYIDPGTGTLLIQWIFGMIFAGLAVMKIYWAQAKAFFATKFGKAQPIEDLEPEKSEEAS